MQYKMLKKDKEIKKFFNSVEKEPLSAMYQLGNLFFLKEHESDKAANVLAAINDVITKIQLAGILKKALNMPNCKKIILEEGNQQSIKALLHGVLQLSEWSKLISNEQIIQMGQDLEFTREALVALVAKHKDNAEKLKGFNYNLLRGAGPRQNSDYVSGFIKECETLPLTNIKALCKESADVARVVMMDIEGHIDRFNIGSYLARQHPEIREDILKNWEETKASLPLDDNQVKELEKFAKTLSRNFPEFARIMEAERIERDQPDEETREARQRRAPEMGTLGFLGFALTYKYALGFATKYVFSKPLVAGALSFMPASVPGALVAGTILAARDVYYANNENNEDAERNRVRP